MSQIAAVGTDARWSRCDLGPRVRRGPPDALRRPGRGVRRAAATRWCFVGRRRGRPVRPGPATPPRASRWVDPPELGGRAASSWPGARRRRRGDRLLRPAPRRLRRRTTGAHRRSRSSTVTRRHGRRTCYLDQNIGAEDDVWPLPDGRVAARRARLRPDARRDPGRAATAGTTTRRAGAVRVFAFFGGTDAFGAAPVAHPCPGRDRAARSTSGWSRPPTRCATSCPASSPAPGQQMTVIGADQPRWRAR